MKISKDQLKRLVDSGSWERGNDYYQRGRVISLVEDRNTITAKVRGSKNYRVELTLHKNRLTGSCTCPMDDMGVFCKHCVAAGLTYLDGKTGSGKSGLIVNVDELRQCLSKQDKDTLLELIAGRLIDDDILREQIMLKAARGGETGCDIDAFKSAICRAMNTGGFVDYHDSCDFYKKIDNVLDSIEELLEEGHTEEVIELVEFALKQAENAVDDIDDSEAYMEDIFERLKMLRHNACIKAESGPEKVAEILFQWEMSRGWCNTFHNASGIYSDVLGKKD
jgi:uncharacterized Zn finger protein